MYVDCNKFKLAADCYVNALKIRHTRAHQGLARVHALQEDRKAAHAEMTQLIEKARNNASAYEKRSEYCDRNMTMADLSMVTQLDPLRTYPYRYRAAGKFPSFPCSLIPSHCFHAATNFMAVEFLVQGSFLFLIVIGCNNSFDGRPQGARSNNGAE